MYVFIVFLYLFLIVYLVLMFEKIEDVFWVVGLVGSLLFVVSLLF